MIAVDTNVLIYAHWCETRMGEAAHALMTELVEGDRVWPIPWPCCYEFLSLATNRRIWKDHATPPAHAWGQFQAWTASPSSRMIDETGDFEEVLGRFIQRPHVVGGVLHDSRIAALCVAHGAEELLTRDRDFFLFPELRTRDPFSGRGG